MKVKNNELRKMNDKELESKLVELRKSLIKMNAQVASGTVPENPGDVRNVKKTIARIHTIRTQKTKEASKTKQ